MSDLWLRRYYQVLGYLVTCFWYNYVFLDFRRDCSGKSTHVHNGNYWFQKINNSHDLENWHICPASQYNYLCQIKFQYYFIFGSYEKSQTFNAHISKLVLWHMSTFSTAVFNYDRCNHSRFHHSAKKPYPAELLWTDKSLYTTLDVRCSL